MKRYDFPSMSGISKADLLVVSIVAPYLEEVIHEDREGEVETL